MQTERHYPNAPIMEALIDFRVSFDGPMSLERLKTFGTEILVEYPHQSPRDLLQGQIVLGAASPVASSSSRTTIGYIFHSADKRQAVQARLDGFTFSRFAPYEDWRHLVSEARRLWSLFVRMLRPNIVQRVAVRYVNQINLPLRNGTLTFENYMSTFPKIGLEEDVNLEQFFLRLVMPQTDLAATLLLTEALLPAQGEHLGVILDLDVFRENLALDGKSDELWAILDTFRACKNKYFEASITDATRELFA